MSPVGQKIPMSAKLAATLVGMSALAAGDDGSARSIALTLSPEERIPAVAVARGRMTTVSFVDSEGAPRPIVAIETSTEAIDVVRLASHPHVATLRAMGGRPVEGDIVVFLDGLATPAHLSVKRNAPPARRVTVGIAGNPTVPPGHSDAGSRDAGPPEADRTGIESVIRDYLLGHPEVIREALDPARQLASKVESLRDEIVRVDGVPAVGDLAGAVTVVEFFDYRCGYCKRSVDAVRQAIAKSGVRVELRDYPILGADSENASRLALAAGLQGRYEEAHFALMEREGDFGLGAVADLASQLNIDAARLETDMRSAEVSERIEANRALAQRLGVTGTPAFLVIGPGPVQVSPGAVDAARISQMIEAAN